FSQILMTTTEEYMTKRLGNEGYTFAEVKGIPDVDEEANTVKVTFFIDPGKRAYVRRINFRGNTTTADNVLRREMRQMEGASASSLKIEQSKVRLERLGFFKEVNVETKEVAGSADLVDVEYTVEEQPSGSIGASVGYAQGSGLVLGANVQQDNWLGTGKRVGFNISRSTYQTAYSFNYTDPYFTPDGVSRGFNVYYQSRDYSKVNVSSYSTDSFGASVNFGYPISEIERVGFNVGYQNLSINTGLYAVQEIVGSPRRRTGVADSYLTQAQVDEINKLITDKSDTSYDYLDQLQDASELLSAQSPTGFIDENGDNFNLFTASASWSRSTLNRGRLASRGTSQRLSLELSLPGGDLEYYKLIYTGQYFQPLTKNLTLRLRTRLGYADSYGDTTELPFFQHFYAGGFGSVRGFKRNTLGPQSTPAQIYDTTFAVGNDANSDGTINTRDRNEVTNPVYILDADGKLATTQLNTNSRRNNPFGGNVLIEGSAEILFPLPFIKDQRTLQSAFFVDVGNVFDTGCGSSQQNCFDVDLSKASASVGIGVTWISGFGPLTFSVAKPIRENQFDETEFFQFSLGTQF
ncbi:MAG: outer membrane protein assembly factor BamA, partial [Cellvibrionaceae bacterium]|nr:outer membrane protein assembly factor BamA [Cellvibrionaceae bacterium]